jgi:SSS family solute:Na+ symporter
MIKHGPGILLNLISVPMAYFIVAYVFIPFFMRLPITSAYEYLEGRFGIAARTIGALFFIVIRIVWMSVVVYTASGALAKMTGTPAWAGRLSNGLSAHLGVSVAPGTAWLYAVIVAVGVFTTFYAAFGGIRAVIWTDVIQFITLLAGAVLTVAYITWTMGLSSWVSLAVQETRLDNPVWSWDPTKRLTIVGVILHYFAWRICTYSSDQTVIQRYLSTRDGPAARRSFLVAMIGTFSLAVILGAVGMALLAFYRQHPDLLTGEFAGNLREQADHVFPYFIAHQLPVGLTGLIIAALFSAAMSSLDSGVNSVSAVITVDFYKRWMSKRATDTASLSFAKGLGLILGLSSTVLALFVDNIEGNIVDITNKSTSCVVGPLFALFAVGIFSRRVNEMGAIVGSAVGFGVGLVVTFSGQWFDYNISFTHIITTSVVVSLVVSYSVSLLGRAPSERQLRFTRREVMRGAPPPFVKEE